jgi:hypothetical protein
MPPHTQAPEKPTANSQQPTALYKVSAKPADEQVIPEGKVVRFVDFGAAGTLF